MHKVMHFHLPVDNMDRAKKFYQEIFGWEILDTGMEKNYHLANTAVTDDTGLPQEPLAIKQSLISKRKARGIHSYRNKCLLNESGK